VSFTRSSSIVIPTRGRPEYLSVTLASVMPQARAHGAEVIVVSDGGDAATARVAGDQGAELISLERRSGANAARNAGVAGSAGELVVFVDDDIEAQPGWLEALLRAASDRADRDVFGGPIAARLEGGGPRACGREGAPITTLDGGPSDREIEFVWSANMAIRRRALERVGGFDETIHGRGEEEEWEQRYKAAGGRVQYVAEARVEHRRVAADATVGALSRAAYALGRTARRNDVRTGRGPTLPAELRTLGGCVWHTGRRRCANGIVMAAHSLGRVRETLAEGRS
jgi:glycosyltransferase involved in cell wall biosynthesis